MMMSNRVFAFGILCFAMLIVGNNGYCYDRQFVESVGMIEGWEINPSYSMTVDDGNNTIKVPIHANITEKTLLLSYSFDRNRYNFSLENSGMGHSDYSYKLVFRQYGKSNKKASVKIYVGKDNGIIVPYPNMNYNRIDTITRTSQDGILEGDFDFTMLYKEQGGCDISPCYIYKIEVWIEFMEMQEGSSSEEGEVSIESRDLNNVFLMNPEYEGLEEWRLIDPVGESHFKLGLEVYHGMDSGYYDIYIAGYYNNGLYFFPYWNSDIYKTTIFIPKYLICHQLMIGEWYFSDTVFDNSCKFYMGVAPAGTLDFINKIN